MYSDCSKETTFGVNQSIKYSLIFPKSFAMFGMTKRNLFLI